MRSSFAILAAVAALFIAHSASASGITVADAWAPPSVGTEGVAYVTLVNHGRHDDALSGVQSDCCSMVQLNETVTGDNGVTGMRPLSALALPTNQTVGMGPGGTHIMLMGLLQPLKDGDAFPMVLRFNNAASMRIMVTVSHARLLGSVKSPNQ